MFENIYLIFINFYQLNLEFGIIGMCKLIYDYKPFINYANQLSTCSYDKFLISVNQSNSNERKLILIKLSLVPRGWLKAVLS
jgi:hypothetical protein